MSSFETIQSLQDIYIPGQQVESHLSNRRAIILVGPLAVGKTTLLHEVPQLDSDFSAVRSFTTRRPRLDEQNSLNDCFYRFLPADEATYKEILHKIYDGALVQFSVHPTTNAIYGSEQVDYTGEYVLLDRLYSSVEKSLELPFRDTALATIIAPPEEWRRRMAQRKQVTDHELIVQRLEESCSSLEWSLNRDQMNWISNPKDRLDGAANEVIMLGRHGHTSDKTTAKDAESLLATIEAERRLL